MAQNEHPAVISDEVQEANASGIEHPPTLSDETKEAITSVIASYISKFEHTSKPAEACGRSHASQPVQSSTLAKAPKPIPSFTEAEALHYMGHYIPAWISDKNDDTTTATMTFIKIQKTGDQYHIWTDKQWIAFKEMAMPRRVKRKTKPNMSDEVKMPEGVKMPGAPLPSSSLVIRKAVEEGPGEVGQGEVLTYITLLDEDGIGEKGDGWLGKVMIYMWALANREK
ncbi:hypothetical protein HBI20_165370 [Parastagonospora nodorum]|nr:hypothetical protein HBI20_165370 [Parastagonospora nodorum]